MAARNQPTSEHVFIRRVLIVLSLAALLFLAWYLRSLLLMLFGAVVVATIFRAVADRIAKLTGCPAGLSIALSIVVLVSGFVALVVIFGGHVAQQVQALRDTIPLAWRAIEARIGELGLDQQFQRLLQRISAPGGSSLSAFGRIIVSIGSGLADILVVVVAGIFLAVQPRFYLTGAIKLVPPGKRELAVEAFNESEHALRLWLKGQLISMVVVGLLTGVGLWALGMPAALALGLLAGLLEFIPFAGPVLAAIPAVLLAFAASPNLGLWVLLLYLVVQQFEGNVLTPLVQQFAVDLPGVVLLFSLLAFGTLFGLIGVILAAPLAVVTYVLVKRLYVIETLHTPTPIPGETKR